MSSLEDAALKLAKAVNPLVLEPEYYRNYTLGSLIPRFVKESSTQLKDQIVGVALSLAENYPSLDSVSKVNWDFTLHLKVMELPGLTPSKRRRVHWPISHFMLDVTHISDSCARLEARKTVQEGISQ
jgi:hypothetical protein